MGLFHTSKLDEECDKAAKVLRGFTCTLPLLLSETHHSLTRRLAKSKIPAEVLASAKGLAIFSGFRGGMYIAGAGGSGVVIARLPDGSWSPPSAFSVMSGSFGVIWGFDMYDCVCVLRSQEAVDAYAKPEVDLGAAAWIGPARKDSKEAVVTYTKSMGIYGGVAVDGTSIREKRDVNGLAFGKGITQGQILKGEAVLKENEVKEGLKRLYEVVKQAEGKKADEGIIRRMSEGKTPGDEM